ncbi:MAG: complex I NDUFA9 subunit family protein [Sphingomonadaceae bacterium]|nr:complex I NDUFA9 subunit family protein [Sphingomonadaceae bacterium]
MASRDPLFGKLVTLIGGSGFVGHHVAQALLERGARLRIASRNPEKAYSLKPLANLGQIQFLPCSVTHAASVAAVVQGADAVVNLVGAFDGDLDAVMAQGAGTVAEAARDAGAQALVHVSAIGADAASSADYARTKALGEHRVQGAFPGATIMRPSIVFGEEDGFVPMMAGLVASMPVLPVFAPEAKLQMVFVDDLADALAVALGDPAKHGGKIFEIAGPEAISMMDFNQRIAAAQGNRRHFIAMPDVVSGIFAALPFTPMGRDQWQLLKAGNVASGDYPGLKQLGIEARPLDLFLDRWMVRFRKHGRFTNSGPLTS